MHLGHEGHRSDAVSSLVHHNSRFMLSVCLTAGDVTLPLITEKVVSVGLFHYQVALPTVPRVDKYLGN